MKVIIVIFLLSPLLVAGQYLDGSIPKVFQDNRITNSTDSIGNKIGYWNEFDTGGNYLGIKVYWENGDNYFVDPQLVVYNESALKFVKLYAQNSRNEKLMIHCRNLKVSKDSFTFPVLKVWVKGELNDSKLLRVYGDSIGYISELPPSMVPIPALRNVQYHEEDRESSGSYGLGEVKVNTVSDLNTGTVLSEVIINTDRGNMIIKGTRNVVIVPVDENGYELLLLSYDVSSSLFEVYKINQ